ncbi:hypothetical protein [Nannocystis sp.]|uniref:hypothetical protein n=1 Tax=Nannocystis sp. TaxID=1962667 RepID=UPI002426BDC6|nr:hypothetical protein [Nannocystis sp.]MBK7824100.1 hypothetical protein [Nannocystis sp.]MBK9755113.1 hypothetical protein [Nannocystis sp.]
MNAPKKPGTDLSALKARLAKKSGGDAAPAPEAAPAAAPAAPAPGKSPAPRPPGAKKPAGDPNFIPAPGEQAPAAPAFIPAPGEVAPEIPAPGEVAQPVAAAAARRFQADDGTPFGGGGGGGGFDPNAGIIDTGGEVQARGNKGIVALAAGAALLLGVLLGYLGNQITSKGALRDQGKAKGEIMFAEVSKVSEMRKGISLKMADLSKLILTDPAKGATELVTLLTTNFEKAPQVDQLFGWQLAAINPDGLKKTFDLYEEANGLKIDLGYLANFVNGNVKPLATGGPRQFAVQFKGKGVTLVERLDALCGDIKAPTPCGGEGKDEPVGFNIRAETGGAPTPAAMGVEEGQVMPLSADGSVFAYIVGLNPENNAKIVVGSLLGRINERLEAMAKAETRALKALRKYSDDPNVDGPAGELD